MKRAIPVLIGLAFVGALIGFTLWKQKGAHMELRGKILNVRTFGPTNDSSLAILDFRFANPSDYDFVVRDVRVILKKKDGTEVEGHHVAEADIKRVFEYYPQIGQKFNESLVAREKIKPKESLDRMVASRFDLPESELLNRQAFIIRVTEVDWAVSELREERP